MKRRRCHGCGRDIDPHAGVSVVFCGRCGDVDPDVDPDVDRDEWPGSIGEGECEICGGVGRLYATGDDFYLELCRRCFDRRGEPI